MSTNILVVEDDPLQAEWMQENLEQAFPDSKIGLLRTELEFRSHLDEIRRYPPDIVIMAGVMLRWTDPSRDMQPPPKEVDEGGFFRAGLRCEALLAENERTKTIPVILYTVLSRDDLGDEIGNLPPEVVYLGKGSDSEELIQVIRRLVSGHSG